MRRFSFFNAWTERLRLGTHHAYLFDGLQHVWPASFRNQHRNRCLAGDHLLTRAKKNVLRAGGWLWNMPWCPFAGLRSLPPASQHVGLQHVMVSLIKVFRGSLGRGEPPLPSPQLMLNRTGFIFWGHVPFLQYIRQP